jgi:P-type Cu2+ transporter
MPTGPSNLGDELLLASRIVGPDLRQNELSVPEIHCGGCVQRIERVLAGLPHVERARVNLSSKRVAVTWRGEIPPPLMSTLAEAGFAAHIHDVAVEEKDGVLRELVRALAVAGFASGNIMMLSVAVWSGADPASRDTFHWLSAAIALPSLAYCGRIFFRSAWQALRHGRTNMDVPISIGVLLAFGLSFYDTLHHGAHAYFDAAISLLFFLLVGRTLDHFMRERARTAVKGLARLAARGATVLLPDGSQRYLPVAEVRPGMTILLVPGDRVPVDAKVLVGQSELDVSLASGESLPHRVAEGDRLQAGTLNLTGPLTLQATAAAQDSFLAQMTRLMETAEAGRTVYRRIADRAARLYAPVVHLTALLTFGGWLLWTDDVHLAITVAIAVLIITCPCALGLAVPMVHVVAARRLFQDGIMVKDGGTLERLAEVDHVVFDKTGTFTKGAPRITDPGATAPDVLAIAAAMASCSRHPYSQAIVAAARARDVPIATLGKLREYPGAGLEARIDGKLYRLGRSDWALSDANPNDGVVLSEGGRLLGRFCFEEELRPEAREAVAGLRAMGIAADIVSGDHEESVRRLALQLDLPYRACVLPAAKVEAISALAHAGRKVLMVGDGLNDGPALAAAHVSMAPASAADVGRNAADLVFLHDTLRAVPEAIDIARKASDLVRQNLLLAVGYNALAVPIAILGQVTPLVAAIAMSLSSIAVVGNALRLGNGRTRRVASRGDVLAAMRPAIGTAR